MPSIYYVKKDGICANDDGRVDISVKRTGTWIATVADYYDSIYDVLSNSAATTDPTEGDFIYVSDAHDKVHVVSRILSGTAGNQVAITSVDNANQDTYKRGAKESTSGGTSDITICDGLATSIYMAGMDIVSGGDIKLFGQVEVRIFAYDCLFGLGTASVDLFNTLFDGGAFICDLCTFDFGHVSQSFDISEGAHVNLVNCNSSGSAIPFFFDLQGDGAVVVSVDNFDAASFASSVEFINPVSSADDGVVAQLNRIKLPTSGVVSNSTGNLPGLNVIGESLKVGSGGGWPQINEVKGAGDNSLETAIYRTLGAEYESGGNYSVDMTTNSAASFNRFLRHKISEFYIDTGDFSSTINFLVHFARDGSSTEYNDDEFWIDIEFNDGLDDGLGSSVTTKPDVVAAGTAPTTETSLWTGLGTNAQMSVNKSATIGSSAGNIQSGMVTAWANFAVASDTVFVDKRVVVS